MATNDVLSKLRYTTVPASEAKNQFGQVLDAALRDGAVVITRHDVPRAVLISIEELESLGRLVARRDKLDTLAGEFDAIYERMQKPGFARAMSNAFAASPKQLGAAAAKAARKK